MLIHKHIDRIVIALVVAALFAVGLCTVLLHGQEAAGISLAYEDTLFSHDQPMTVNILMDEDDWQDLLDTALSETYYCCNVEINGETYYNVGIRAKGNTSLSSVAASDSDRFSFKIQFDEYTDGQTCQGLDKLVLNNNYADATMMKEAVTYDMFAFLGADASLYQYANISVNGEYWGVYLALEAVEDSFAMRNYGAGYGQLYKPENMSMGGGNHENGGKGMGGQGQPPAMDGQFPVEDAPTGEAEGQPSTGSQPAGASASGTNLQGSAAGDQQDTAGTAPDTLPTDQLARSGGPGGMGGSGSTTLNYIDDDLDSYTAIWDASVFDSTDSDHTRVVTALQQISQGEDLETYLDVDNMLRYMAVQTFVVNLDSLTGNMAHNYYLYEDGGQLNLIPWDYNLAFGGFQMGDASSMINFPIDTPFSGVSLEDRQFFKALLEDPDYLEQYHTYLQKLVEEYVDGGRFDILYHQIRDQIDELVAEDPTAFYSYEEYDAAAQTLYTTVYLRGESIAGQLDGSLPSTTEGQSEHPDLLVDASSLDLSVMGSQMGGHGGFPGHEAEKTTPQEETADPNDQSAGEPAVQGIELEPTAYRSATDAPSAAVSAPAAVGQTDTSLTAPAAPPDAGQQEPNQLPALTPEAAQAAAGQPTAQDDGSAGQTAAQDSSPAPTDAGAANDSAAANQDETDLSPAETNDSTQSERAAWGQGGFPGQPDMGSAESTAASSSAQLILLSGCLVLMLLALFGAVKFCRK